MGVIINPYKVSAPAVDTDAQAFITATGITDTAQKTAIDTLVKALKNHSLWSKLYAIYPFVGGSAATHKFNLKDPRDLDAAYRLSFNGTWTHASTGAKPSSGYANTFLNMNSVLSLSGMSFSMYGRLNVGDSNGRFIGLHNHQSVPTNQGGSNIYDFGVQIIPQINTGISSFVLDLGDLGFARILATNSSTQGFFHGAKSDTNHMALYKNGTSVGTNPSVFTGKLVDGTFYLGATHKYNDGVDAGVDTATYDANEYAFISIGGAMDSTDASNLYSDVLSFEVALGRNV